MTFNIANKISVLLFDAYCPGFVENNDMISAWKTLILHHWQPCQGWKCSVEIEVIWKHAAVLQLQPNLILWWNRCLLSIIMTSWPLGCDWPHQCSHRTHFTKGLRARFWKLVQILFIISIIFIPTIQSGYHFAHATTAKLSWHVQNGDLIGSLFFFFILEQFMFFMRFSL